MILKGEYTGVKKVRKLKHPDILYSVVHLRKKVILKKNEINIEEDRFSHMYDSIEEPFSGRAYKSTYTSNDFKLQSNKLTYTIPEFEYYDAQTDKPPERNVKVDVYLTDKGVKKIRTFLTN